VRKRVLAAAIATANEALAGNERDLLPARLTPHSLRRAFASLLFAISELPPCVMGQHGHTTPQFTVVIWARQMGRRDGEPDRVKALVEGS
jgi:integrase